MQMHTSKEIKRARKKLGLSQQQLADKMGISKITVSRWERGQNIPRKPYAILLDLLISQADLKYKSQNEIDLFDLLEASNSSAKFWDNDIDDEVWNGL